MCTVVVMRRPDADWPLLIAANRDELNTRPWEPPRRHWPDRPEVVAGLDVLAGGSWMGINDHGVVAAVLNRLNTLGPADGKRSRGELVLEALDHAEAIEAVQALADLNGEAYRPFNMVVADNRDAYWIRATGRAVVEIAPLDDGLSMLTAMDLNDPASPRTVRFRPLFAGEAPNLPSDPSIALSPSAWGAWPDLLGRRDHDPESGWGGAMNVDSGGPFGTVSSSLLALPRRGWSGPDGSPVTPVWLFAPGRPDQVAYAAVDL